MQRFDTLYRVKRVGGRPEFLTEPFFDDRFRDLDLRLDRLEGLDISWEAALLQVRGEVLTRSEQVISDLRDKLIDLTQLQWLTALSGTEVTLDVGELQSFAIDADYRDLFTPGPFVLLSRAATPDDYAVARTSAYYRETGQLVVETLVITGGPGSHSDWVVSAIAGSTLAQLELLNQALALQAGFVAAHDQAVAAAATATNKAAATSADRTAVADDRAATGADRTAVANDRMNVAANKAAVDTALASIASGPVFAVAGLTGNVTGPALKTALNIAADIAAAYATVVGAAPAQLDTINELAAALGNDANFAATITAALAGKANVSALPSTGRIVGLAYGDSIGF
jgi:hypothetical protein